MLRLHCPPDTGFELQALAGGLRSNTLPLGHGGSPQYWIFTSERRRFLWNLKARAGFESAISDFPSRQLKFNHCTRVGHALEHFMHTHWPNVGLMLFVSSVSSCWLQETGFVDYRKPLQTRTTIDKFIYLQMLQCFFSFTRSAKA